jgi:sigma-E factor negative regulatory protein RseB
MQANAHRFAGLSLLRSGAVQRASLLSLASVRYWLMLLCSMLALPAVADEADARQWLERMSHALATRNYEGKFYHLSDSQSEAMRIIHRVVAGQITERVVSLDGGGREIVRTDKEITCFLPDQRAVLVERRTDSSPLIAALPTYSKGLESHYSIDTGAIGKVLGHKTQLVVVSPRDEYRYGYRLWLDYESAMPLKSQLCDREGKVIEQILFAELNLRDDIDAASLKPDVSTEGFTWYRQDAGPPDLDKLPQRWRIDSLPAGFKLTNSRLQVIAGSRTAQHFVYSDGLASVSIFIEPRDPKGKAERMRGLARLGSAFAYSREVDGHQVTAVGEVPAATVKVVAGAVKAMPGRAPAPRASTPEARPAPEPLRH